MDAAIRETEEEAGIKAKDLIVDHNFEKVLTVLNLIIIIFNYFERVVLNISCTN